MGQSLFYTLGSITFLTNTAITVSAVPFPISAVAGGVAGGVGLILLLVLVVAIIVVVYRRDSVKKRQQVSALMVQMETLETNTAEECKRGKCILAFVLCYIRCLHTYVWHCSSFIIAAWCAGMMVETTFCVIKTCNNSVHLFNMLLYAPILLISHCFVCV